MTEKQSRTIIEALRSGISSHDVGEYFSSARPGLLREFNAALEAVSESRVSGGKIVSGKYGEGKTHLLNTIYNIAHQQNMVVSVVTLSKETPLAGLNQIYPKLLQNTYLPGKVQPGIAGALEQLSLNSPQTSALLEYCLTHLEINKLYYVLKSYLATQDAEEKYLLLADLEGDIMAPATVRKIYKRIFGETAIFNEPFVRSKHFMDYFSFLSRLFLTLGYGGWVLLFDEAELTGRLGRKSRHQAYLNLFDFLHTDRLEAAYSVFAFNSSYAPDVIDAKNEYENLEKNLDLTPEQHDKIIAILGEISSAKQLTPLSPDEITEILSKIREHHSLAYHWSANIEPEQLFVVTEQYSYLLRTRIRAAIEILDQLFQYGEYKELHLSELGQISFEEEEEESIDKFL